MAGFGVNKLNGLIQSYKYKEACQLVKKLKILEGGIELVQTAVPAPLESLINSWRGWLSVYKGGNPAEARLTGYHFYKLGGAKLLLKELLEIGCKLEDIKTGQSVLFTAIQKKFHPFDLHDKCDLIEKLLERDFSLDKQFNVIVLSNTDEEKTEKTTAFELAWCYYDTGKEGRLKDQADCYASIMRLIWLSAARKGNKEALRNAWKTYSRESMLNFQDREGNTALILAIKYYKDGDMGAIEALLNFPGIKLGIENGVGANALTWAINKNKPEIVRAIWLCALREGDIKTFTQALSKAPGMIDINAQDTDGNTALILAIKHRQNGVARILLKRKPPVDVEIKNHDGYNALKCAKELDNKEIAPLIKDEYCFSDDLAWITCNTLFGAGATSDSKDIEIIKETPRYPDMSLDGL